MLQNSCGWILGQLILQRGRRRRKRSTTTTKFYLKWPTWLSTFLVVVVRPPPPPPPSSSSSNPPHHQSSSRGNFLSSPFPHDESNAKLSLFYFSHINTTTTSTTTTTSSTFYPSHPSPSPATYTLQATSSDHPLLIVLCTHIRLHSRGGLSILSTLLLLLSLARGGDIMTYSSRGWATRPGFGRRSSKKDGKCVCAHNFHIVIAWGMGWAGQVNKWTTTRMMGLVWWWSVGLVTAAGGF